MDKRFAARRERVLVDKATGEEIVMREQHTMFFVPMRYWAIAGAILIGSGLASLA